MRVYKYIFSTFVPVFSGFGAQVMAKGILHYIFLADNERFYPIFQLKL